MSKSARPTLRVPERQAQAFLSEPEGKGPPAVAAVSEPSQGRRGYVTLADGSVRRRLVCAVDPDIGLALEKLRYQTGAPVSYHVERILREGLGLA